jgi:hypothetical protein
MIAWNNARAEILAFANKKGVRFITLYHFFSCNNANLLKIWEHHLIADVKMHESGVDVEKRIKNSEN